MTNSTMALLISTNISSPAAVVEKNSGVLTEGMYDLLIKIIVLIGLPIGAFGTAGNIVNIIVYIKMGFAESTNISLMALACSDLGVVVTAIGTELVFFLPVVEGVSIAPEVSFTLVAFPHLILTRVSALITAFISLERYLCVLLPLKIRQIITPKKTLVMMVIIFTAVISPMITVYFRYPLGLRFFPEQNCSLLGILPINDTVIETSFIIFQIYSSTILPISAFVIVTVCTIFLSINLRRSKMWRESNRGDKKRLEQATDASQSAFSNKETSKETKAIKMVVVIATVFIISSIPSCIHIVVVMVFPDFDIAGPYADIFIVSGNAFFVVDTINCSANVIIYYKMSSKFRQAAQGVLRFKCLQLRRQGT